jgi:hypothetical protein
MNFAGQAFSYKCELLGMETPVVMTTAVSVYASVDLSSKYLGKNFVIPFSFRSGGRIFR